MKKICVAVVLLFAFLSLAFAQETAPKPQVKITIRSKVHKVETMVPGMTYDSEVLRYGTRSFEWDIEVEGELTDELLKALYDTNTELQRSLSGSWSNRHFTPPKKDTQ